jgi:hypothetical protein
MQVYTAIINGYDKAIKNPDVVFFTEKCDEPFRRSRWYKTHPHVLFPGSDYTLWVDGNIEIIGEIPTPASDIDIMTFKHSRRNCTYEEAAAVIKQHLDEKIKVYEQVFKYTKEGYPSNAGLYESPVILRKNTDKVNTFNEAWWEEICKHSRRDQISFTYLTRKMNLKVGLFEGTIEDNPVFKKHLHREKRLLPEDESCLAKAWNLMAQIGL